MKIDVNQIPLEGLTLEEELMPAALDLETEIINFRGPIKIKAQVAKITNAVCVRLALNALMRTICSRCLEEFEIDFKKAIGINYSVDPAHRWSLMLSTKGGVDKSGLVIDLDPEIREEIIIDYPIKPLCKPDCKGLCPKCGRNLNEGNCGC